MDHHTAYKHTNLLWIFLGIIFCALFLVFSLPKGVHPSTPTGAQIAVFTPSVITVSSVSPSSVYQAATVELSISGVDFNSSAVITIENVTVLSTIVVNDTLIQANVSVPITAGEGAYDINITQDTETGMLIGGLTILEGPFDPSTLVNVTPSYFVLNGSNTTAPVSLTYNITTAPGVDKAQVSITGGFMNVTNLNTSNWAVINLTNVTDPQGTFTLQFAEHSFTEDGSYEGEVHLDLMVDGTPVEWEHDVYFKVGVSVCFVVLFDLGGECCPPGEDFFGECAEGDVCGKDFMCETKVSSGTPAVESCPPETFLCSVFDTASSTFIDVCEPSDEIDSASIQPSVDGAPPCGLPCFSFFGCALPTFKCPSGTLHSLSDGSKVCVTPPPPPSHGGGGGSNPYPAMNCCCLDGPLKGQVLTGPRCLNSPTNTKCSKSTQNVNDPVCKPPAPVPIVVPQPKLSVQAPVQLPPTPVKEKVQTQIAPPQPLPSTGKAIQMPVQTQASSSSLVFAVLALMVIVAGFVYWQFFHTHK